MKWRIETKAQRRMRQSYWHPWFAWYPVTDGQGRWFWLETIERCVHRKIFVAGYVSQYRACTLAAKGQDE